MFLGNTPRNMKHSLYTFRISCEFRVLLMPRKNKPQNPLTFRANADPNAKYEKQKKGHKIKKLTWNTPLYTFHFSHFAIKCIAGLSEVISSISIQENPFVFHKVIASTAKQCETWNTRNLFCEVTRKNTRNLYAHFVSLVFLYYEYILWASC